MQASTPADFFTNSNLLLIILSIVKSKLQKMIDKSREVVEFQHGHDYKVLNKIKE